MEVRKNMSFEETIRNTAQQKADAACARAKGAPAGVERPRDVFLMSCEEIARGLAPFGYAWKKSRKTAVREAGDFRFEVSFQANRNNVAGQLVAVWIHAVVCSNRLREWRGTHLEEAEPTDYVGGGQIGNLQPNQSWMEWNLANPGRRAAVIADAVSAIRQIAFPFFALFENLPALITFLRSNSHIPGMDVEAAIRFLHCFSDPASAEEAGKAFLKERPEFLPKYKREVISPRTDPIGGGTYALRLALLARRLGLDFTP